MSSTEVYIVEVYVWMESSSDEMRRLIHEFYLSCRQQEIDQVDRSSQCKRIMHQFFVELEKKDPDAAMDADGIPYSAAD